MKAKALTAPSSSSKSGADSSLPSLPGGTMSLKLRRVQEIDSRSLSTIMQRSDDLDDNRRLLLASRVHLYDTGGFRKGRPLRTNVFYSEPFLTCRRCNDLLFLDAKQLRLMDALLHRGHVEPSSSLLFQDSLPEGVIDKPAFSLPPCKHCNAIDGYIVGAHDFSDDIEDDKQKRIQRIKREHAAASLIARAYRKHLFALYGKAVTAATKAFRQLQYKAAIRMQAVGRGRLARRRAFTERSINIIRTSHPLLIRFALKIFPHKPKTFWYKRQLEIDLLYQDYLSLVEKTGFTPARIIVEQNLQEIARRIMQRKNELIVFVQKLWRGFMSRRIVNCYKTELYRLFGVSVARVMRIQRVFRGHRARLSVRRWQLERQKTMRMKTYLEERRDASLAKARAVVGEKLVVDYLRERKEEYTARVTEKLPYALHKHIDQETNSLVSTRKMIKIHRQESMSRDSLDECLDSDSLSKTLKIQGPRFEGKMRIFHESIHGDDRVLRGGEELLARDRKVTDLLQRKVMEDITRREFINSRIAERGPLGLGLRCGPISVRQGRHEADKLARIKAAFDWRLPSKLTSNPITDCSRSKGMKAYFAKELEEIAQRALLRIGSTSFSGAVPPCDASIDTAETSLESLTAARPIRKLTKEFKTFNKERLAGLQNNNAKTRTLALTGSAHQWALNNNANHSAMQDSMSSSVRKAVAFHNIQDGIWRDIEEGAILIEEGQDDGVEEIFRSSLHSETSSMKRSAVHSRGAATTTPLTISAADLSSSMKKTSLGTSGTKSGFMSRSALLQKKQQLKRNPRLSHHMNSLRKDIEFPKNIYFNAMDWLYADDMDVDDDV